ncbi:MAG: flavodoxin family protein [Eggerthellaceae bacterium]
MADVRTIICGSPQRNGKCACAAGYLRDALQGRFPEDQVNLLSVADLDIDPCVGCNACLDSGGCVFDDGMSQVLDLLGGTDYLYVICPVYFAGPPSQMKALLDRLQPLFAAYDPKVPKRPAKLMAVGQGGDPHGYAPLETIMRSALAVAGFRLEGVLPCIGESCDRACDRALEMIG